ncbi:MAG: acetyl-CoA carboxylase biotin carboxyl carrier protein subunit, partial [Marinomonas sp.]
GVLDLFYQGEKFNCHQYTAEYEQGDHGSDNSLSAPMNGSMVSVMVSQGDKVSEGQTLVIMEAMKMEHAIKAPHDGIIDAIYFNEGELVSDGAELLAMSAIETQQESVS